MMLITFTIGILCCLVVSSEVASTYRGSLSSNSARFVRAGQSSGVFYYQALQLTIRTTGEYTIRSDSLLDTYGYLYANSFDPSYPTQHLIAYDDDSGASGQFLFNATLGYGRTFVLVVTTYAQNMTGSYLATAFGPSTITFHLIPTPTPSPLVPSTYSSSLSYASGTFIPPGRSSGIYYYEAIQVTNYGTGKYTFRSSSPMDTYGYFYSNSFDPTNSLQNLIASDDDSGGSRQFLLNVTLTYGSSYILVVTTYAPGIIGDYSVTALGPATIIFNPIPVTTSTPSTTTSTALVPSHYSTSLSSNSGKYIRPGQTTNDYFYQAIRLTVYTDGKYAFRSSSSMDTYGYFYSDSFDPSNPSENLIVSDDDSGGNRQFLLNVVLTQGESYILVVTTYSTNVFGDFTVHSLGPATVSWTEIAPTLPSTFGLVGILTVVFTSIAFLGIILSVCAYCYARHTRQRTINVKPQLVQMPYFISLEKPPLSNN